MVPARTLKYFLFLTLTTLACGLTMPAPTAPTMDAVTQVAFSLTADQLKNASYELGAHDDHALVQLTNGKYQQGTDATTLGYASVVMTDFVSFGDLDHDGVNEGAAVVYENYGGTGNFGMLALYSDQDGKPVFVTSTMIDDRPTINGLTIENNEMILDAIIHGFDDPGCCASLSTKQWYRLVGTTLHLMKYISLTPDGQPHEIKLSSPMDGDSSNPVQVKGDVSIAPFENTLSYHVYELAGTELTAGPVPVIAADPGAPGTFDSTIDLSMIPAGSTVFLEIQDLSAVDGSIIAKDAVQLTLK